MKCQRLGLGWLRLVQIGPARDWSRLVHAGPGWFMLVQAGPGWFRLVQAGPGWFRLVQAGLAWIGLILDRRVWVKTCTLIRIVVSPVAMTNPTYPCAEYVATKKIHFYSRTRFSIAAHVDFRPTTRRLRHVRVAFQ